MEDEALLDHYLESGEITESKIREMIAERKIFPCFFGSALKLQGVNEFLSDLAFYTEEREYPEEFGARILRSQEMKMEPFDAFESNRWKFKGKNSYYRK